MTGRCPGILTFTCPLTPAPPFAKGGIKPVFPWKGMSPTTGQIVSSILPAALRGLFFFGFPSSFPFRVFGVFRGKKALFCFFRFVLWLFRFHGSPMTDRCPGILTFTCPLTPRAPL
jgi:hypothetical protein